MLNVGLDTCWSVTNSLQLTVQQSWQCVQGQSVYEYVYFAVFLIVGTLLPNAQVYKNVSLIYSACPCFYQLDI